MYAKDIVAFPKVSLREVQKVWNEKGQDFLVDERVMTSMEIETKYAGY